MRWSRGCVAALGAAAAVAAAAGCCGGGGGGDAAVSVPAAPGAPLTARVLGADELGLPGYTASREPVVAEGADASPPEGCPALREAASRALTHARLQAQARRAWRADGGGALSAVWEFATPAGAAEWNLEQLREARALFPGCAPDGVRRTSYRQTRLDDPPGAVLEVERRTGPDGPDGAANVVFHDGRFAYLVGVASSGEAVPTGALVAAARRLWARREG